MTRFIKKNNFHPPDPSEHKAPAHTNNAGRSRSAKQRRKAEWRIDRTDRTDVTDMNKQEQMNHLNRLTDWENRQNIHTQQAESIEFGTSCTDRTHKTRQQKENGR